MASGEERIIFMTTNHPEKLDPALIRPGRVDLMEKIDDATPEQARSLFDRFYGGLDESLSTLEELEAQSKKLGHLVEEGLKQGRRISMAALQGLFIRNESHEALEKCHELFIHRRT